jgi:hypothetical protein
MQMSPFQKLYSIIITHHFLFQKCTGLYLPERVLHELKLFGRHRSIQAKANFICRIQFQLKDDEHFFIGSLAEVVEPFSYIIIISLLIAFVSAILLFSINSK